MTKPCPRWKRGQGFFPEPTISEFAMGSQSIPQKFCTSCKTIKPCTDFSRHKKQLDGLQIHCKDCYRTYVQKNRLRIKTYQDAYRQGHREKRAAYDTVRWFLDQDERKAYWQKYAETYVDKTRNIRERKRRALKNGSGETHTLEEIQFLMRAQGYHCANCEANLLLVDAHLDHFMPLAKQGSNGIRNLQWLCRTCNIGKNSKDPYSWLSKLGKLCLWPPAP